MTGRPISNCGAYPVDPWVWGFCTGYLAVWRVLRLFGVDLDD